MSPRKPSKRSHSQTKKSLPKPEPVDDEHTDTATAGTSGEPAGTSTVGEKSPAVVSRKTRRHDVKSETTDSTSETAPAKPHQLATVQRQLDDIFGSSDASSGGDMSWADLVENSPASVNRKDQLSVDIGAKNESHLDTTPQASPIARSTDHAESTPPYSKSNLRRSPRKRMNPNPVESPSLSGSPSKRVRTNSSMSNNSRMNTPNSQKKRTGPHRKANPPVHQPTPEGWVAEPKLGWVLDQVVIARRSKELKKGYESSSYQRYIAEVPKESRLKGVHPKTPNKWVNFPRRSWDTQVRQWRKEIHIWAGDSTSNMSSLNTSFVSEASGSDKGSTENLAPVPLQDPNDLASLLGHYDLDSRKAFGMDENTMKGEGESTLKAKESSVGPGVPTDFSLLKGTRSPAKRSMSVV